MSKNQLGFVKPKKSAAQEAFKALKLTDEDKKKLADVLKGKGLEIETIPVRLKLTAEEKKSFECYVSLAIDEGKANKNIKVATREVVTFAVKKLLKNSFLQQKMKEGYKAKTEKERKAEEKKK